MRLDTLLVRLKSVDESLPLSSCVVPVGHACGVNTQDVQTCQEDRGPRLQEGRRSLVQDTILTRSGHEWESHQSHE